ncbi:MAG: CDP-diacylglycerol--glycerol-3-phosphate 3-phosphatidyltransferase [Candidatus Marinimicrobia bacterium]|nr:CDP-diacylglycerol--glycerol-3-phosphate 3-phosphatidyltransferase [Candidatus Neomarinimicrobiota bacterium]MBT3838742.1 CDP-diacylglycerol--glycerol-3-phosphate 3-phosphatidyltransferase [Candidatus Neomarinimicrobiota bacterium]MBT3998643.1 CDP-diacylglycerol--glycerol-3-phosphate 3-phosphatidyltransferase [Candidatus Neomarinimicrobiota bacterium]MBT4578470.1 CDP-diacylglycerol--glycerol-3-phosphate 3-phosphatidyltransferase [Candidatus Neomarinimicrobiota bacterium]MBT5364483.1 CDP-diac
MTPVFILCLFWENTMGHPVALAIFIVASITDAYDGYYARKYDQVTPEGKFLDPLADKILVSSAFISFALMGIIEFWMVGLILFRDLFVTGLRMAMERKGLSMVTSNIAKAKTAIQMITISFTLIILGLKALSLAWAIPMLDIVKEYHLVYNLTLMVTIFTVITGVIYLYSNRTTIQNFLENE